MSYPSTSVEPEVLNYIPKFLSGGAIFCTRLARRKGGRGAQCVLVPSIDRRGWGRGPGLRGNVQRRLFGVCIGVCVKRRRKGSTSLGTYVLIVPPRTQPSGEAIPRATTCYAHAYIHACSFIDIFSGIPRLAGVCMHLHIRDSICACLCTSVPSMSLLLSLSKAVKIAPSSPGPSRTRKFCSNCALNAVGSIFICVRKQIDDERATSGMGMVQRNATGTRVSGQSGITTDRSKPRYVQ